LLKETKFVYLYMLFKKIKTFFKALFRHAENDFTKVPMDVWSHRFNKCMTCKHKEDTIPETCKPCGCVIYLKTEWASEECPKGKWKRYEGKR